MSFWLALWIVISLVLIVFFGWSLLLLQRQKITWKKYAAKHKLRYKPGAVMEGAEMDGTMKDYKISFFPSEHEAPEVRGVRKLTAIEINLHSVLPIDLVVASSGMVPLAKGLGFKAEVRPEHDGWSKAFIAAGANQNALKAYLTDERLGLLTKIMKAKNTWMILVNRNDRFLLRIDTPNPLDSPDYLDKIARLMLKTAKALEMSSEEERMLKIEATKTVPDEKAVTLEDADLEASGLQLEDDEVVGAPEAEAEDTPAEAEAEEPVEESGSKKDDAKKP